MCAGVLVDPASSPGERAVGLDIRARGEVLEFVLAGRPPSRRAVAIAALQRAVDGYRDARDLTGGAAVHASAGEFLPR